jgi:citrate synthase
MPIQAGAGRWAKRTPPTVERDFMAESTKSATLTIDGKSYELPIHSPTVGPDVMDIRKLYAQANVFTYDPGFTSTAACDSTITFIDGDEGVLLHRGYPIDQLASQSHYLEVCYLLLYGELPSPAKLEEFENLVTNHTMIHEQMVLLARCLRFIMTAPTSTMPTNARSRRSV